MLKTGERYVLNTEVLGVEPFDGRQRAIMIPRGAAVRLVRLPCAVDDRMAEVEWEDRTLRMFAMDLVHRAALAAPLRSSTAA